ncbi:unnamed protein product, partial [Didymodactylos carnosus]
MFRYCLTILATISQVIVSAEQTYTIPISPLRQTVEQRVTKADDDLVIMNVPANLDRQHAVFYHDYRDGLELVKYVDLKPYQLSKMDPQRLQKRAAILSPIMNKTLFNTTEMQVERLIRLENDLVDNTIFLRKELQEACTGMPIYWTQ